MARKTRKNKNYLGTPTTSNAAVPSSFKKGKGWLLILGLFVIAMAVEVGSVLKNQTTAKSFFVKTILAFGGEDQPCKAFSAWDVALSGDKWIALSDQGNKRILIFDRQGKFIKAITDKEAGLPKFNEISKMTSDSKGNIYVADAWNGRIRGFDLRGRQIAMVIVMGSYGPRGVAWDNGDFLVADSGTHRVVKVAADGAILNAWGQRGKGNGMFDGPNAVALDAQGNIYVSDAGNNRVVCMDAQGKFIRNFDVGAQPYNVAVDSKGLVYITSMDGGFVKVFKTDGKYLGNLVDTDHKDQPFQPLAGLKITPEGDLVGSRAGQVVILHPTGEIGAAK